MGHRITVVFEILIVSTLFALFGGLVVTTSTNDAIIEHTEDFVETVRYKGCITDDMYYEFINGFETPVDVRFVITKTPVLASVDAPAQLEFTNEVIRALENADETKRVYKMNAGDEIQVTVRKTSGNLFSALTRTLADSDAADNSVVAIKGGMILNTQYE